MHTSRKIFVVFAHGKPRRCQLAVCSARGRFAPYVSATVHSRAGWH